MYRWNKTLIEGLDAVDTRIRGLDMSRIGSVLTGDRNELRDGPQVHAMLIQNQNPVTVCPDSNRVRRGFSRDDLFVATHEQFLTETARWSDVVLPATMFMEHDDLYQAGGHSHIQIGPKLIEPPGECRSNHELLRALAHRLGAKHPGFDMTAMEIIDATLKASGWPDAETVLRERWIDAMPTFEDAHYLNGFPQPDKRFHFAPDWARFGENHAIMPRLPDHMTVIEDTGPDRPFRLVTAPARSFLNTSFSEMKSGQRREGRPTVKVHPEDARRLGIGNGDKVRLGNDRGEVVLHATIATGQLPGVLVSESIWPSEYFEGGIGINALTSDDPGPPFGGAVFHDTSVWLRPATGEWTRWGTEVVSAPLPTAGLLRLRWLETFSGYVRCGLRVRSGRCLSRRQSGLRDASTRCLVPPRHRRESGYGSSLGRRIRQRIMPCAVTEIVFAVDG